MVGSRAGARKEQMTPGRVIVPGSKKMLSEGWGHVEGRKEPA